VFRGSLTFGRATVANTITGIEANVENGELAMTASWP